MAESEIERPGFYRGFHAVGKTLTDVKEFAALVRLCERTNSLERLSEMAARLGKTNADNVGRQLASARRKRRTFRQRLSREDDGDR